MLTPKTIVVSQLNLHRKPKYSFVLPFMGTRPEELTACIQSIKSQLVNVFELILVHQGYQPTYPSLSEYLSDISSLYLHTNQIGISIARNIGAFYAQGEYLLFAEDDGVYPSNFLQKLDLLECGQLDIYHGRYVDLASNQSSVPMHVNQSLSSSDFALRHASSLCLITRRSDFIALDGFDTRLGLGPACLCLASEEIEFLCRAIFLGFRLIYVPQLFVYHPMNQRTHRVDFKARALGSGAAESYIRLRYLGNMSALKFILYSASGLVFNLIRLKSNYCVPHLNRLVGTLMILPSLLFSSRAGFSYVTSHLRESIN